ncbi:hypothetical protein ACH0B5_07270 [Ureibacillus sp. 179-F W5.1 NHS]|uniref:hypothetical protein n=1 Tax=Ureibacillus sp. 179-F W5.1 NHS TaxID=3374297 RepID=UPI003879BCE0
MRKHIIYPEENENLDRYFNAQHYNNCPHCNVVNKPEIIAIISNNIEKKFEILYVIYQCSWEFCKKIFLVEYNGERIIRGTVPKFELKEIFPKHKINSYEDDVIKEVSHNFIEIYNQAIQAEELGLNHICGMGYRKALEFLIKDFAKLKNKDNQDTINSIENLLLGQCINKYIEEPRIKAAAKRAAWIGNDETHYIRKWQDKDIRDLKKLIEITCYYIIMDYSIKKYELEMQ